MDEREMTEEEFLAAYDASRWPHPALTADIAVFRRASEGTLQLLMVKRANHPFKGAWALPGGFFEPGETIEQTAARELAEEAGLSDVPLELFGIYSTPGRDPRDWVATAAFCALLPCDVQAQAGDDAASLAWFDLAHRAEGTLHTLELVSGECRLQSRFTVEDYPLLGTRKALVVEQSGFAFDHSRIVADAWLAFSKEQNGVGSC